MKIQVLGSGCPNCKKLYENVQKVVEEHGLSDAYVEKVESMEEIVKAGVMSTPALAVDGKVVSSGKVLSPKELEKFLV